MRKKTQSIHVGSTILLDPIDAQVSLDAEATGVPSGNLNDNFELLVAALEKLPSIGHIYFNCPAQDIYIASLNGTKFSVSQTYPL